MWQDHRQHGAREAKVLAIDGVDRGGEVRSQQKRGEPPGHDPEGGVAAPHRRCLASSIPSPLPMNSPTERSIWASTPSSSATLHVGRLTVLRDKIRIKETRELEHP